MHTIDDLEAFDCGVVVIVGGVEFVPYVDRISVHNACMVGWVAVFWCMDCGGGYTPNGK